ncbi:MAG TPA: methyltransferase domain-containing protein [Kofleriaceae bacterium]|jgi:ubiquinone/menaquinone biosynthesis C-methylase UbiE|nr:methyltransferase domain-containing protein [Kofleriaceae bacterium]
MSSGDSPNQEFIDVWNKILVPKFTRFRDVFVRQAQEHSDVALARHPPRAGERVLDVGCGFGETTIQIAQLVGATGAAVGLDPCEAFLETGRADARAAGLSNVSFVNADAQTHTFDQKFDLIFGRFGIMFFAQPVIALRNLRAQLKPGGRALFVVWRTLEENPPFAVAKKTARTHLPAPPDDGAKCGPGPFSMADPETTRAQFTAAGFKDVEIEPIDVRAIVGVTIEEALDIATMLGPAGEIVREAGPLGQEKLPLILRDLAAALEPWKEAGGVIAPQASWCISANA